MQGDNAATLASPHADHRPGFTLVELLMVLILVGILAGMLLMAVNRGLLTGKNARTTSEIQQLATSIETYRTERGSYPPTFCKFASDGSSVYSVPPTQQNQQRILRHIAKAFPRYIVADYATLELQIATATQYAYANVSGSISSFYNANGVKGFDIAYLDPAEAIVFWLGGLPDPTSETKLAGFRLDPSNPFVDSSGSASVNTPYPGSRANRFFPFDAQRLVDYDGDGWWEYIPPGGTAAANTPPFVYFDSGSYWFGPAYPYPSAAGSVPAGQGPSSLESQWGNTFPYAADPATGILRFVNSKTYQIISAGLDNQYDDKLSSTTINLSANPNANPPTWWFKPEYFPSGTNYDTQDRDNLTNFTDKTLGDAIPQ